MPFDSNGNFTRVHNWEQDRKNNIDIVSDRHDEEDDNFENGFNECMLRDGRIAMEGNLKMGNFQVRNMAKGTLPDDAVTKEQIDSVSTTVSSSLKTLLNKLWKIGDIKASVKNANHDNWFLCNGQAVSRVTYSELFSIIGTNFGAGDGKTTFNLPDYRGKFLRGLGGDSASNIYTTQAEGLPNITGSFGGNKFGETTGAFTFKATVTGLSGGGDLEQGTATFDASRSSSIYGASSHVTPINQAVNYFIKVKEEA